MSGEHRKTTSHAREARTREAVLPRLRDGRYERNGFAIDEARDCVLAFAVFHGTRTGPGGPGEPTGRTVAWDYVHAIEFDGDRIRHLTRVWNDAVALQQLGWA